VLDRALAWATLDGKGIERGVERRRDREREGEKEKGSLGLRVEGVREREGASLQSLGCDRG